MEDVLFFAILARFVVLDALLRTPSLTPHRLIFYLPLLINAGLLLQGL